MRLGMGRKKIRIGDVLIAAGAITEEQLQELSPTRRRMAASLVMCLWNWGL